MVNAAKAEPAPTARVIEEANRAQLAAYEKVNAWYIDWADFFRQEVGYHAAVKLGITAVRGTRAKSRPEGDDPDA